MGLYRVIWRYIALYGGYLYRVIQGLYGVINGYIWLHGVI